MTLAAEGVAFFWMVVAAGVLWWLAECIGETLERWAWEDALRARMAVVQAQMDALWPPILAAVTPYYRAPILRPERPAVLILEMRPTPIDWAEEDWGLC